MTRMRREIWIRLGIQVQVRIGLLYQTLSEAPPSKNAVRLLFTNLPCPKCTSRRFIKVLDPETGNLIVFLVWLKLFFFYGGWNSRPMDAVFPCNKSRNGLVWRYRTFRSNLFDERAICRFCRRSPKQPLEKFL